MACGWGVAFGTGEGEGGAAWFEDRVEEDAETRGEFEEVGGMAEPGCPEGSWVGAAGEESGFNNWDGNLRDVGFGEVACEAGGGDFLDYAELGEDFTDGGVWILEFYVLA